MPLFKALIDLDRKDFAAAEKDDEVTSMSTTTDDESNYWSTDYIAAWSAFEQGEFAASVDKANLVITNFTETIRPDINELNALVASYLLKAHALTRQGEHKQAAEALQDFKDLKALGITGKLVTPMPYRKWIEQTTL